MGGAFDLEGKPLGVYSTERAFCLDYVLDAAAIRGIYLIPCLNQTRLAMSKFWTDCLFNKAKGGSCEKAAEYFTSEEAKKLVKRRLRYTIARWGYSRTFSYGSFLMR